jgi:lysophospholipase L1-like esterase
MPREGAMKRKAFDDFRDLMTNLGLVVSSLLVLFGLAELGFRIVEAFQARTYRATESWAVYDEDLGYRPRPNHEDSNADGLRDDPIDPIKTKYRILILGDSVAFYGDSIDDTYVGRLENKLNSDQDLLPTEVINAGIRGYTNYQELVYLKKYGLEFEPDLVGVSFVLNDLHLYLHQFRVENGEIIGEYYLGDEAVQSVDSHLYRLARKSHFLVWLRRQLSVFDSLIDLYAQNGFTFEYRPDFNTAWEEESWVTIDKQLSEMVHLSQRHGIRVFLVIFPFGEQLREDYLAKDYVYVTMPQRRLKTICQSLGIPCLDLFSVLDRDTHLESDGIHLTKSGRALVAKELTVFLKEQNLVPIQPISSD